MLARLLALFMALLLCSNGALASIITKPNTYSPGQTLPASSLNSNFDTIYNDYNGNITNANISGSANIALSKLNPTSILFILMASGSNTLASGATGDTVPRLTMTADGLLKAGPGGASALDIALKRASSSFWALRTAADSAYVGLQTGNLEVNGTTTLSTPLPSTSGGTGQSTVTAGDVLIGASNAWNKLALGTSGQVLTSNGSTVTWQNAGSGTVTSVGASIGNFPLTVGGSPITSSGTITLTPSVTAKGYVIASNGSNSFTTKAPGTDGQVLTSSSASADGLSWTNAGAGTVTSVGLTMPGIFSVTGSPVTGSGTLAASLASQSANLGFMTPDGAAGAPTFRALVNSDLPILSPAKGGTGQSNTISHGCVLGGNSSSTLQVVPAGTINGQALVRDTTVGSTSLAFGVVSTDGGGTGRAITAASVAKGDLLAGTGTGNFNRVAVGTNGQVLTADSTAGSGVSWQTISGSGTVTSVAQSLTGLPFLSITGSPITTTGTLALAASCALGDIIYGSASNTLAKLTGNTTTTKNFLTQTGNGTVSAAPAWGTIVNGDLPVVDIAHGGTNNSSLSVSAGVVPRGDGTKLAGLALGTAGQVLTVNGGATDITWATPSAGGSGAIQETCNGRLTLTSGTAVTTSDVTAATTLYFTPFRGNQVAVYNGSSWVLKTISELSLSLSGLTANTNYDIFVYDNAGTMALDYRAWTSDTTRSSSLYVQDGVLVRTSATTEKRYVGTIRITGTTGQCEDSTSKRFVYNYYNRVRRFAKAVDTANSWTYSSTTIRAANSNTTDGQGRFSFVSGTNEDAVEVRFTQGFTNGGAIGKPGIGIDSTTANSALTNACNNGTSGVWNNTATYMGNPAIGYHYVQALESCSSAATVTFYGAGSNTGQQFDSQSGLTATLEM